MLRTLIGYILAFALIVIIAFGGSALLKTYFHRSDKEVTARVTVKWSLPTNNPEERILKKEDLIKSEAILGKVVDNLALYELWSVSREKAYVRAKMRIGVSETDDPDFVTIFYIDKNTEVAKQILSSVIQEHSRYLIELQKEIVEEASPIDELPEVE